MLEPAMEAGHCVTDCEQKGQPCYGIAGASTLVPEIYLGMHYSGRHRPLHVVHAVHMHTQMAIAIDRLSPNF